MKWLLLVVLGGCISTAEQPIRRWTPVYADASCEPLKVTADGKPLVLTEIGASISRHRGVDETVETLHVGAYDPNSNDGIGIALQNGNVGFGFGVAQRLPGTVTMLKGSTVELGGKVSVCVATPPGGVVLDFGSRRGQRIEAVGRIDAVIAKAVVYDDVK